VHDDRPCPYVQIHLGDDADLANVSQPRHVEGVARRGVDDACVVGVRTLESGQRDEELVPLLDGAVVCGSDNDGGGCDWRNGGKLQGSGNGEIVEIVGG